MTVEEAEARFDPLVFDDSGSGHYATQSDYSASFGFSDRFPPSAAYVYPSSGSFLSNVSITFRVDTLVLEQLADQQRRRLAALGPPLLDTAVSIEPPYYRPGTWRVEFWRSVDVEFVLRTHFADGSPKLLEFVAQFASMPFRPPFAFLDSVAGQ